MHYVGMLMANQHHCFLVLFFYFFSFICYFSLYPQAFIIMCLICIFMNIIIVAFMYMFLISVKCAMVCISFLNDIFNLVNVYLVCCL